MFIFLVPWIVPERIAIILTDPSSFLCFVSAGKESPKFQLSLFVLCLLPSASPNFTYQSIHYLVVMLLFSTSYSWSVIY